MSAIEKQLRDEGRDHAVQSWRHMFEKGSLKAWTSQNKNTSIDPHLETLVKLAAAERPNDTIRLLDVGSGPISMFSKNFAGWNVSVHAADPLADDYAALLADMGIDEEHQLARPVKADCEALSETLGAKSFDFIIMRNALDHTADPVASFDQLLRTCSINGYVLVEQFENEAKAEKWSGFHQWNIWQEKETIFVQGKETDPVNLLQATTIAHRPINVWRNKRVSGKPWCGALVQRIAE